jgi:DMSO/TMAO reductase YedYZ molybdopterin-dependent catalytic subunit
VEGWSCIGKWTGAPLAPLLVEARLKPEAKFILFRCFDSLGEAEDGSDDYYESIGLADAYHPQTILAYALNGAPLTVAHGAPLRLRAERHLGYKQAKYVTKIEAIDSFASIHGGKGGYWEDRGYEWYSGL